MLSVRSFHSTVLNITDYLNQEQYDDVIASLREGRTHVAISGAKSGNLSVNSFKNLLSTILGLPENDERLVLLCMKVCLYHTVLCGNSNYLIHQ